MWIVYTTTDSFRRFLESGNYKIQIVAHVERKSAVVLSGRSEASYSHFFIGRDVNCSRSRFPLFVEKPQKLSLTSLQTPQE